MEYREPDEIFNDALDLRSEERAAFLDKECGGNQVLQSKIEDLLARAAANPSLLRPPNPGPQESFGPYRIIGELGRGAMGVVYLARDEVLDRDLAIKVLPPHASQDRDRLNRFLVEARLPARLNHPNVATIYETNHAIDSESDRVDAYIAMEYIKGETLAHRLSEGKLPERGALEVCLQVARALEHAHEHGIIHRDLKPANVMIRPDGFAKVLDFGIAKALGDLGTDGLGTDGPGPGNSGTLDLAERPVPGVTSSSFVGTPGYMSPEQVEQGKVDPRTDIWAFGCLLYECLTGRRAFEMATDASGSSQIIDVRTTEAFASSEVVALVDRCLQRSVDDRPVSMSGIVQAIESALRRAMERATSREKETAHPGQVEAVDRAQPEKRSTAHPDARSSSPHGPSRRRRVLVIAVVVSLLGALAAILSGMIDWDQGVVRIEQRDRSAVRGVDETDTPRWTRELPGEVTENYAGPGGDGTVPYVHIWNHKRLRGAFVPTINPTSPGSLCFLRAKDGKEIWTIEADWIIPRNAEERANVHFMWQARVLNDSGDEFLFAELRNGTWYQSACQLISLDRTLLGTYYHPGHLFFDRQYDLDNDGHTQLVLFGENSSARFVNELVPFETEHHCGTVVLLSLDQVKGQAFPYSEPDSLGRDWPGVPRAREDAYLAIPPIHLDEDAAVTQIDYAPQEDGTTHLVIRTHDERAIYVDQNLRPYDCWLPPGSIASGLRAAGEAQFPPVAYVHDGVVEYVEVPVR